MIDSHCHLHYPFEKSVEVLAEEARSGGVTHLLTVGTNLETIPDVLKAATQASSVLPTGYSVGVHPLDVVPLASMSESELEAALKPAASQDRCVALGEMGLDSHRPEVPLDLQIRFLRHQLEFAREWKKPVIIHSREAELPLLEALEVFARSISFVPGVIHCFTGSEFFAKRCLDLGFYLSFSGILTFKKATTLQELAKQLPLESLLIETDAPFLAPTPFRGKPCEPRMVSQTLGQLAALKALPVEQVDAQTTQNTLRCFPGLN